MSERHSRFEGLALLIALVFPSLLTLVYFVWLAGAASALQQAAYGIGKAIQFALPLVWVPFVARERIGWPLFNPRGLFAGAAFGLVIVAGMFALYFGYFRTAGTFAAAGREMLGRLSGIGITSPASYAAMALFYSLLHSLLEEYYWRWFVFGRLKRLDIAFAGDCDFKRRLYGASRDRAWLVFRLDESLDLFLFAGHGGRRRILGVALPTQRLDLWSVGQPFANRCRDFRHRLRSGACGDAIGA